MGLDPDPLGATATTDRYRQLLTATTAAALILLLVSGRSGGRAQVQANQDAPSASGQVGAVFVRDAWIPTPIGPDYPAGSGVVVSLQMRNFSPTWDRLSSSSTPVSPQVGLSQFNITQDFISMPTYPEQIDGVVQLFGITRPLAPGEQVLVTLHFVHAGPLTLQVPVRPRLSEPTST
jgi:copper(I)-binding protein